MQFLVFYLLGFIYTNIYSDIVQICIIESKNVYIRMFNTGGQHHKFVWHLGYNFTYTWIQVKV